MNDAQHFESEGGLARFVSGAAPSDHEKTCDICKAERARYAALGEAIARLPGDEPPPGWQDRVLRAIDPKPHEAHTLLRAPSTARRGWLVLAAAAAILVALFVVVPTRRAPREELALRQEIIAASGARAEMATIGDSVRFAATSGAAPSVELRVYRDENELVLRCPGAHGCSVRDGLTIAELKLTTPGTYRAVAIVGQRLPPVAGSIDEDVRAARAVDARVQIGLPIRVR